MIQVNALSQHFGSLVAVDQLSFNVEPGEVLGFLGPNGAGKSTTMKMITGFLRPTAGDVTICGHDVASDPVAAKRTFGYLPEGAPGYGDMSVRQFLNFIAAIRDIPADKRAERIAEVEAAINLGAVMDRPIEALSKGYRRRVGLAQAIMHDPQVLILDEPTDGLDPNQKHEVRELIKGMAEDKIIIISTHILEEVTAVCSRALIIDNGTIVFDGKPDELAARSRYYQAVTVTIDNAAEAKAALATLPAAESADLSADGRHVTVFPVTQAADVASDDHADHPSASLLDQVNNLLRERGWQARGVYQEPGRLDEVFRQLTTSEAGV